MKNIIYVTFLLTVLISSAQRKTLLEKAERKYDAYRYSETIKDYEKLVKKGYSTTEIAKRLGDSYFFNARYVEATKWYNDFLTQENPLYVEPIYFFRYSLCLKSMEDYDQANEYLFKYYEQIEEYTDKIDTYLDEIDENSGRYEIENAGIINTKFSDYGTSVHNGDIIFTSSREHKKNGKAIMGWNNQHFSSIYYSTEKNGKLGAAKPLLKNIISTVNESTLIFTKDGKKVYFTRNNFLKERGFSSDNSTLLKIYQAELVNGEFINVKELPFCSDQYSVAHPTLSPDEKIMYFVSDMPGGLGESDIWKVEINSDGTFGMPINLGPTVNTKERESFPFVSADNKLYYASNGKLGLGGLDVFVSVIIDDDEYEEAINLGRPINSSMDDFGFFVDVEKKSGFFTSNRPGGKGDDDIYRFKEIKRKANILIEGVVINADNEKPVPDATINLFDENGQLLATQTSDENGEYNFRKNLIPPDTFFKIQVEKAEYLPQEKSLKTPNKVDQETTVRVRVDIAIRKEIAPSIAVDATLTELLNVVIYFDLDKWNIREDATVELNKILKVMQDFPKIKVDIRSHTDSRHSYQYNEELSEKRAQSTKNWLVSKGISPDRLTAKGYGEYQLLNHCKDRVQCSETEHAINRRSEFIITSVE